MIKEAVKILIKEFQESAPKEFVPRHLDISGIRDYRGVNKVVSIIGPRRTGKTTYLFQVMREIIAQGARREDILYINFEDERLLPIHAGDLQLILDGYFELYGQRQTPFIFLDEIQNVAGWEKFVRRVNDRGMPVILTGSNSRMLSREIATALRGRTLTYEIFPFSFAEYLSAKGLAWNPTDAYGKGRHPAQALFENYLYSGGYPEIALVDDRSLQTKILQGYFDTIFYRDLVDRYKIKNSEILRQWLNSLIVNTASLISLSKTAGDFASRGLKVSKATLSTFARYVEDVYLGFFVEIHSDSVRQRQANPKKFYLVDQGLHNHLTFRFSENRGRLLENIVFMHLRRAGRQVTYYKTRSGHEVDLLVADGRARHLVQVCAELVRIDAFAREKRALVAAMNELKIKQGTILTLAEKREEKIDGKWIRILPVWEWMMSGEF